MSDALHKPSAFEMNSTNIRGWVTCGLALIAATGSLINHVSAPIFSVHDLKAVVASIDTKVDAIIAHNEKTDQDSAMEREYTNRRFNWLDERVTIVETRTSAPQYPQQMPAPADRYQVPTHRR